MCIRDRRKGYAEARELILKDPEFKGLAMPTQDEVRAYLADKPRFQATFPVPDFPGRAQYGTMKPVYRKRPTLGAKPPEGAIVLFDGNSLDHWENNTSKTDDGLLTEGSTSTKKGQGYKAHVEFRLPYMPESRGQARGNSGFYVQGRYEIQMLDSFGLDGKSNECGGAYGAAPPNLNMCFPPLSWQTYDVDFTAPEFKNGKKSYSTTHPR